MLFHFLILSLQQQSFRQKPSLSSHCKRIYNKKTGLSGAWQGEKTTITPTLYNQSKPPECIAKLFQECGVVLHRIDFIEDAVAKGEFLVKLSPDSL